MTFHIGEVPKSSGRILTSHLSTYSMPCYLGPQFEVYLAASVSQSLFLCGPYCIRFMGGSRWSKSSLFVLSEGKSSLKEQLPVLTLEGGKVNH